MNANALDLPEIKSRIDRARSNVELPLPVPSAHSLPTPGSGAQIGQVVGFTASGSPCVDFADNLESHPLEARHTCLIGQSDLGRGAVLVFENNDLSKPIILGLLQANTALAPEPPVPVQVNSAAEEEQVILTAQKEIVLRCGKASITLTRAGKVLIRGAYLLSRSSGANRIKGGSVQIN